MNTSYMRYWQPSQGEQQGISWIMNSIAVGITYPMEFVKTRIQIRAEGYGIRQYGTGGYNCHKVFRQIHEAGGGFSRFYHGFQAHYLSRISYVWIRNWLYYKSYHRRAPKKPFNDLSYKEKAVISGICGAVAGLITAPLELINVRFINDTAVSKELQRNYEGIGDAYSKITKTGGVRALYQGGLGYAAKMFMLNASMTWPYDFINEWMWIHFGDLEVNRLCGIGAAAVVGTVATLPFDNIRTRMMKLQSDTSLNRINYSGSIDCFVKAFQHESALSLWVGAVPFFYKCATFCFLTVYLGDAITNPLKERAGLKEYQIKGQ